MTVPVTLDLDAHILKQARTYAAERGIKLDSLVETLLRNAVWDAEDKPIAEWVAALSNVDAEHISTLISRSQTSEYYEAKRKKK